MTSLSQFSLAFSLGLTSFVSLAQDLSLSTKPIYARDEILGKKSLKNVSSLNELFLYAAENNADLQASWQTWQAELLRVNAAGVLPDPQISFTHYFNEVETRVGPQENAIAIMQKLPWFGKLDLKESMQSKKSQVAYAKYQSKKATLFRQVETLYADFYYLDQSIKITTSNKLLLSSFEQVAQSRLRNGASAKDLIKVQVELIRIEERLSSLKLRRVPLKAALAELLNVEQRSLPEFSAKLAQRMPIDANVKVKLFQSLEQHPQVQAWRYQATMHEDASRLAEKNGYPDFAVGLKYIDTSRSDMNVDDNGKDPLMATFSFTLPLNQSKYRDLERASHLQELEAEWQGKSSHNRLERRLTTALYTIEDYERQVKLYRNSLIPKNQEAMKLTLQAYQNGKANFIELIDLQRQVLEFLLLEQQALTKIYQQEAILRELNIQNIPFGE